MTPGGPVETVLLSGARLAITRADFPLALGLLKELLKTTEGLPSGVELMQMETSSVRDLLVRAATSEEAEKLLFLCLERCTYDNTKVTRALFDDPKVGDQIREDYFQIAAEVVKVNCLPFVKRIASLLKAATAGAPTASPASPSGQTKP